MRNTFVRLSNTAAFMSGYEVVERRGAAENCFMVVDGKPGYGKTSTAQWFAISNNLPFIRAKREWRPSWMLRELLETVQTAPAHSYEKIFQQVIEAMGKRSAIAAVEDKPFAIIVDEADHVVGSSALMETLRDISDLVEVPILLIGMGRISAGIKRFPQIASRAESHVEFKPLTLSDTRALVEQRCEVPIDGDLLQLLHDKAEGYAREVLTGLAAIERTGKRLDHPVTVADMAGQELLVQRSTGHAFTVRG
ncbi:AAA domain-containing protein [Pleomorphomonas diazotrophica]|uniref:AAA family ATPase n=1 Tax=Pleomorphomonas diazotrophica TaxID=1166257 RepID=UPI0008E92964|nr:AAA family ATPase [Pleomorphomonas diazotrophica]SFM35668.1 AAA domain-containing protein [Pleomorphomonas diazotrophica]